MGDGTASKKPTGAAGPRAAGATRAPSGPRAADVASRLHSAAIHLLRRLRAVDAASGLTAPRLSALSVLVFGGAQTVSALAAAEQVRVPTMTRLVQGLEADGLVTCAQDPADRRRVVVTATRRGTDLLKAGRARRVSALARQIAGLDAADLDCLERAAALMESVQKPADP